MEPTRLSIAIVYGHALLGEGIGRLLAGEPGVHVTKVPTSRAHPLESAARARPDVILVERGVGFSALEVLARFPEAVVIDFAIDPGPTWVYRRQEIPGHPQAILDLVRIFRGGHPAVLGAGPAAAAPVPIG